MIKIETGKRYQTRDGRVTGIVEPNDPLFASMYPFTAEIEDHPYTFTEDGLCFRNLGETNADLVKVYKED